MAEEAASASVNTQADIRYDWIQERVCSSIKGATQDSFEKLLLQAEAKCDELLFVLESPGQCAESS
jgi:hypothetical protein